MKKPEIMNNMSRTFHRAGLHLKKHSPEILVVAGVVGTVAGAVMACKATLKVNEVVDEAKNNIDKIHEAKDAGYTQTGERYSEEDSKKDLAIVYTQTGVKFVKLYGPAVAVGALSITSILKGHCILRKRNAALAAAYTVVNKGFKEYRSRVVERFGKDLDHELRYNIKAKEVEEKVANEDGSETTVTKTVSTVDPSDICDTSRIWYEGNKGFTTSPTFNMMYLKNVQRYCTEKLEENGHLFLNEVYDALGFDRTSYGQEIGWIYDKKNPVGDNFVDFGLYDIKDPDKARFVNGDELRVLLEFNHDGPILHLI